MKYSIRTSTLQNSNGLLSFFYLVYFRFDGIKLELQSYFRATLYPSESVTGSFYWSYWQCLPNSRPFDTQMTKMQINVCGQVLDAET